jgi:hypothetical protein
MLPGTGRGEPRQATHQPAWLQRSDPDIMLASNAELRGLAHYDRLAQGAQSARHQLDGIWPTSWFTTLAGKPKTSVHTIAQQLRGQQG